MLSMVKPGDAEVTTASVATNGSRKIVVDAGAAIRQQRLDRLGGELYTPAGVYREIKDEKARAYLATMPFELLTREAPSRDVAFVRHFAKLTGDLGFLSQNDIELIALTVNLHREAGGVVRETPSALEASEGSIGFDWAPSKAAGTAAPSVSHVPAAPSVSHFDAPGEAFKPPTRLEGEALQTAEVQGPVPETELETAPTEVLNSEELVTAEPRETPVDAVAQACNDQPEDDGGEWITAKSKGKARVQEPEFDEDDSGDDSSGAGEWVTAENMNRFGLGVEAGSEVKVACVSTDYSVQNVLLQMGLVPLTFDGYAVRTVKLWGLVCRGCFTFTRDTTKLFCPKCGQATVVRVPITVDNDGRVRIHDQQKRRRNLKGTVYSIPKPQGGRVQQPIYAEDQLFMNGRDRQIRHEQNAYERDRCARDPFAVDNAVRPWHQRGSGHSGGGASVGYGRRNPNANNFRGKKK